MRSTAISLVLSATLCGCASPDRQHYSTPRVSLPAAAGWYGGERVYYITAEITNPSMALNGGITYAPRLTDAIPEYPKPPATRTVLERVYRFPDDGQEAVFASAPRPPDPRASMSIQPPLAGLFRALEEAGA